MAEFCMPSLGADMTEGILVEWYVKPGDHVKRGDIIAVVETSKANIEIEVFEDGIIEDIRVHEGEKVPVGAVMAMIRSDTGAVSQGAAHSTGEDKTAAAPVKGGGPERASATVKQTEKGTSAESPMKEDTAVRRFKISPAARRKAAQLGVDLSTLQPSEPNQVIHEMDVEKAAAEHQEIEKKAVSKPAGMKEGFNERMRQAIAAAMSRSNRDIPHYYLEARIDMTKALERLAQENSRRPIQKRLLPAVLLVKAAALALKEVPELNGYWMDDRLDMRSSIHIGFTIALRRGGLIAPAIHDADQKTLDELMAALKDLITRSRSGQLRSSEMNEATIMLTSLGDLGVEKVFGVIYPPQVALVGFGKIMDRPWAEGGMIGVRPVITATLAGDHRATDGLRGARFIDALTHYLQEADTL